PPASGWRAMPSMAWPARWPMPLPPPIVVRPAPIPAPTAMSPRSPISCADCASIGAIDSMEIMLRLLPGVLAPDLCSATDDADAAADDVVPILSKSAPASAAHGRFVARASCPWVFFSSPLRHGQDARATYQCSGATALAMNSVVRNVKMY